MRVGTFMGMGVVMSNKNWKHCLKRVDVARVEEDKDKYVIRIKCPFCSASWRDCEACPLDVFALERETNFGCVRLFKLVAKKVGVKTYPALFDDYVSWDTYKPKDRAARKVLKFIHAGLLKMREKKRGEGGF